MLQQGQVFKLRGGDGRDVWALAQHDGEPETVEKLRWLLRKPVKAFGARRVR